MYETQITVRGTVLNQPERRATKANALVTSFRMVSNARRYDRLTDKWTDGPSFRVKVNCFRRLAEGVCDSVYVGDPVLVYGRIATREWKNEQGETRFSYEIDAEHVGHDLSRGTAQFKKHRSEVVPSVVEDAEADLRVAGELTTSLTGPDRGYGEPGFDDLHGSDLPDSDLDAMAILRSAGLDPTAADPAVDPDEDDTDEEDLSNTPGGLGSAAGRGRKRGRQPVGV